MTRSTRADTDSRRQVRSREDPTFWEALGEAVTMAAAARAPKMLQVTASAREVMVVAVAVRLQNQMRL